MNTKGKIIAFIIALTFVGSIAIYVIASEVRAERLKRERIERQKMYDEWEEWQEFKRSVEELVTIIVTPPKKEKICNLCPDVASYERVDGALLCIKCFNKYVK